MKALYAVVREALAAGQDVRLPGLGVLKVREAAARSGRNPRTGEVVSIPAGRRVRFSMAEEVRALVNP
jgi:DNA-binding protein HU-beta